MADLVWYYARGEVERGPFTSSQIRALVNASKVRPEDLVWREGMENWTVAREVAELFPSAGSVGVSEGREGAAEATTTPPQSAELASGPALSLPADIRNAMHRVARVLTLIGVVVVLATAGCESLGERRIARLTAAADLSVLENAADNAQQRNMATRASLEHQAASFTRGVALHMGQAMLLVGAFGLLTLADRFERVLGVGMILVVVLAALATFR